MTTRRKLLASLFGLTSASPAPGGTTSADDLIALIAGAASKAGGGERGGKTPVYLDARAPGLRCVAIERVRCPTKANPRITIVANHPLGA
jgi:hypothetical protein